MKLKCRCGHEVVVRSTDGAARTRCLYCGREYTVSQGSEGKLSIKVTGPAQPDRAAPRESWPVGLGVELEQPFAGRRPRPEEPPARARPVPSAGREPTEAGAAPAARQSWWYYVADAWRYPLRGDAKWTLLLWLALNTFIAPFLCLAPLFGLFVPFVMLGLLVLYEFELVRQSAFDAEADPRLPGWEDWHESVLRPLGLLLAIVVGSGIPFFAVALPDLLLDMPGWWLYVDYAGLALSLFMLPINMLAVAASDSPAGINPKFTFPAVLRIPLPYTVCAGFCALCLIAGDRMGSRLTLGMGGGFLGIFAGRAVWLYGVTVAARALGTLHYAYSDRMGWLK